MLIYSKKIIQFVQEIKTTVKLILSQEIKVKVERERFYYKYNSYPISVVVYNNKSMLGYFDAPFYELGFHTCLMQASKQELHNVIRHELAHYMTYIQHGSTERPHSAQFRAFCERLGWGEEIYKATCALGAAVTNSPTQESSVLRKVQKLMALSTSSNPHEAEGAMIKSQQLLLKHNMEYGNFEKEEEQFFLRRLLKQKKIDAKMRAISRILETFFVTTVYNRTREFICLEILGSAVNVEIAEYVATVLQEKLDTLWDLAQTSTGLKGTVAKNSFFLGLAQGYCNKIGALKKEQDADATNALIVIEKKLTDAKAMAYRRLSSTRSQGGHCAASSAVGEKMGRELNINPALNKSSNSGTFIAYKK